MRVDEAVVGAAATVVAKGLRGKVEGGGAVEVAQCGVVDRLQRRDLERRIFARCQFLE